jgi:hypothetical protein
LAKAEESKLVMRWEGEERSAVSWLVEATIGALNRAADAEPIRLEAHWRGLGNQDEFQADVARALREDAWPPVLLDSEFSALRDDGVRVRVVQAPRLGNVFSIEVKPLPLGAVAVHAKRSQWKDQSRAASVDRSLPAWRDALRSAVPDWDAFFFDRCVTLIDEVKGVLTAGTHLHEEVADVEDKLLRRHVRNDAVRLSERVARSVPTLLRRVKGASRFFLGIADGGYGHWRAVLRTNRFCVLCILAATNGFQSETQPLPASSTTNAPRVIQRRAG